jgi:YD repeat-containing protein
MHRGKPLVSAALAAALGFSVPDASGAGGSYTYDLPGRVATALYDNGICVAYGYDAAGNRTAQTNASAGSPAWGSGAWGCFSWTSSCPPGNPPVWGTGIWSCFSWTP